MVEMLCQLAGAFVIYQRSMSALSNAASSGSARTQSQPQMAADENGSKVASFDYTS